MAEHIFQFVIYPGMIFAGIIGGLLSWFDRKITARVQFRKGPPLLQPYYDFLKLLLVKETILPARGSAGLYLFGPVLALFGASAAAMLILGPALGMDSGFGGDLIVVFYLLTIPSLMFILTALAAGNPLASVGASREMKLILSYELTFVLLLSAIVLKSGNTIHLGEIIAAQQEGGAFIGSISGVLLFIAGVFVLQAKMGMVPFDMAEAETELSSGMFIEYSGSAYALIKYTKFILMFILPAFLAVLLMGGLSLSGWGILWSLLKILAIVLLMTLIRNTNPRVKIKQAMSFFFIWMNALVILAIILTYFGL